MRHLGLPIAFRNAGRRSPSPCSFRTHALPRSRAQAGNATTGAQTADLRAAYTTAATGCAPTDYHLHPRVVEAFGAASAAEAAARAGIRPAKAARIRSAYDVAYAGVYTTFTTDRP